MTRTKDKSWAMRHEKHLARNGLSDIRGAPKKAGAGFANWGSLEEQIADMQQQSLTDPVLESASPTRDSKLQLVDEEAFYTILRRE
ncbi:hypothetical protein VTP01DRAFT_8685 [Rhizomucor pusillus]|uniref:uncharacterized protein n=1 Tax=Rhizomucor pusillus TaxID=4840 RepID=UPI003743A828